MSHYFERFNERRESTFTTIQPAPYLMYFQAEQVSDTVNTDALGFRISRGPSPDEVASVGGHLPSGPLNLLVGGSSAFGMGATSDSMTLASQLWAMPGNRHPWLNFSGRGYNSTQEVLLYLLHRAVLSELGDIVFVSGFNNLALARLPVSESAGLPQFFGSRDFFRRISDEARVPRVRRHLRRRRPVPTVPATQQSVVPDIDHQIESAVAQTQQDLLTWKLLTAGTGGKISFALQPLASWVRDAPCAEESQLFEELDGLHNFTSEYADVIPSAVGRRYAHALADMCLGIGIPFTDLNTELGKRLKPVEWVFVDRVHFTDHGHHVVAEILAKQLLSA